MRNNVRYILIFPGVVLLCFFLVLPLLSSLIPTFFPRNSFSFQLYSEFFKDSYFMGVLWRTLVNSFFVTLICAVFGLPVSYVISGVSKKWKGILIALTLFPLLTNSVIRSFAWITILGKNGVINSLLLQWGIIKEPITLLYTDFSIIIETIRRKIHTSNEKNHIIYENHFRMNIGFCKQAHLSGSKIVWQFFIMLCI